jgi:ubiquitin carboxyl-terminal hydrolase 8
MDTSRYQNKGLSGLANLGNTCFINSCMQILSHTYELNDFLENETYKRKLKNTCESALLLEWDNLRKMLWNENCIVSPGRFVKVIHKVAHIKGAELFTGYTQNDAYEFLLFLIDCFHTAISREVKITISGKPENDVDDLALQCFKTIQERYHNDYSEIWNLFYGVHVSQITRVDNGCVISNTPEPYFMVDLPIPSDIKSPSLLDCLNHFVKGEFVDNYKDELTKEVIPICRKFLFWSFPSILAIDLKRFNNRILKNQTLVDFPIDHLDLSPYVVGYKKEDFQYELYGVCNHSGGVAGGHYTSFVRNANGKWYHFNETDVSEVPVPESIVTSKAYVLFYRKKGASAK